MASREGSVDDARSDDDGTRRIWIGRFAGPLLAVAVHRLLTPVEALSPEGRATAAIGLLMAVWWMTEAMPLPATSLLPIVLFPLTGVTDVEAAAAPFADPVIFLFGGGFLIAQAVERWGLHRRIALRTVLLVGTRPRRLIGGFMIASGGLSMWISNSATTVMMLPIGMSLLALVATSLERDRREDAPTGDDRDDDRNSDRNDDQSSSVALDDLPPQWQPFATALMLSIAYAASIGSVATIIGTPPNGIMAGYLAGQGIEVGFGRWMLLGLPIAVTFMVIAWFMLTRVLFTIEPEDLPGGGGIIRDELEQLGAMDRGERITLTVFVAVAALWVGRTWLETLPGLGGLNDAAIAVGGALALFLAPVDARRGVMALDWERAKRIPWGVLILFGGGLSLAGAIDDTGVAAFVGTQVTGLGWLAVPALIAVIVVTVVLLTELTSNTATAAVFLPILGGVAAGLGLGPAELVIPATLAATFAFMLPVATPPNAIVFGSGRVRIAQMVRSGIWLNLIGVLLNILAVFTLGVLVFGLELW